ncbi:MAG TPA: pyrroline-5-carboxylate reductase [Pseudorhodoplanes sp.]|nr:pyrroline-5-carboxylate reductase [Pseudorhodoplanes sp.]
MTTLQNGRLKNIGPVALIGAGKMGGAMLEGWLASGLDPNKVVVVEPNPAPEILSLVQRGVTINPPAGAVANLAAVVLAVKPQVAPEVMAGVAAMVSPRTLVLSIMAGRTIAFLEGHVPGAAVVRTIPNTPAAIGRGMTVAVANARVSAAQRALADDLLAATGAVEWVEEEALIDAATAVSGSGPAYVFLLAETLAKAGVAAGLPQRLADNLARVTVSGAGELLHRSPLDPATLRKNVTSPGGTTAAALEILMGPDGLEKLMREAVAAATGRSRELAG